MVETKCEVLTNSKDNTSTNYVFTFWTILQNSHKMYFLIFISKWFIWYYDGAIK